ncbi:hypothetical protein BH24ACT5_BH24ACT5_01940 [soil metagenome]
MLMGGKGLQHSIVPAEAESIVYQRRSYEVFRSTSRFSALDGFRAISVVAVIWHHVAGYRGSGIGARGDLGVNFFFVISGFLITTLLLRERESTGRISLRNFVVRRTLRIFPLYYVVLLAYIALVMLTTRATPAGRSFLDNLPAFLTYTSNWFVELDSNQSTTFYFAWSLATEEQFYLFWPPLLAAVLAVIPSRPLAPILAVTGLLAIDLVATHGDHGGGFAWTVLASLATPILLGAGAAILAHHPPSYRILARLFAHPAANVVALTVTVALLQAGAAGDVIAVCFVIVVLSSCINENTLLHPVLKWRPLAFIGTISYGIYLMHMLAANVVRKILGRDLGLDVFALTVPVVVGAAALSNHYLEQPIRRLKGRFEVATPAGGGTRAVANSHSGVPRIVPLAPARKDLVMPP